MFPFAKMFSGFLRQSKNACTTRKRRMVAFGIDRFDVLEHRRTLAGNVAATILDGNLYLVGDNGNNQVEITVRDSKAVVNGLEGTLVNGSSSFQISTTSTIGGKLFAWMLGGDDQLIVRNGVTFPDSVEIHGGSGEDEIGFEAVTITNDVLVAGDEFADTIAMNGTRINRNLLVRGGSADDVISMRSVTVGGTVDFEAGSGHDGVEIRGSTFNGLLQFDAGKGNDTLSLVDSVFSGTAKVSLGRGADLLRSELGRYNSGLDIQGNSGKDMVEFTGTTGLPAGFNFDGGRGQDAITGPNSTALSSGQTVSSATRNGVDNAIVAARITAPVTGLTARAVAAQAILRQRTTGQLTLTAQLDQTKVVQSSGIQVTQVQNFPVEGTSIANAVVEIARDGDGVFNDGTAIVGVDGKFSIPVSLVNNAANNGVNNIVVRATDSDGNTLTQNLRVYFARGSVVRMASNRGNIDFELFDSAAPLTTANFMNYFARYADSMVHRSINAAGAGLDVIQGGGFDVDSAGVVTTITPDSPVQSEFSADRSNRRGTLAMALPSGNPNGGTNQWFVNLSDNNATSLDQQQFTVFGRVIGDGLVIADAIQGLNRFNLARGLDTVGNPSLGALTDVPLQNYNTFTEVLDGTASLTAGSNVLTGTGTSFLSNRSADGRIQVGNQVFVVNQIVSDTQIQLATNSTLTVASEQVEINARPTDDNYVSLTTVTELTLPT